MTSSFPELSPHWPEPKMLDAKSLCREFLNAAPSNRFILGQNVYTESLVREVSIAGIIDDYATKSKFEPIPLVQWADLPKSAIVINAAGGNTLSAKNQLEAHGVKNIDYFAFLKFSELNLKDIVFNENFELVLEEHLEKFRWVNSLLEDQESKQIYSKILSFRVTKDLDNLSGFTNRENLQYFEDFLQFETKPKNFLDVGGFDGFTSAEFLKKYPELSSVLIVEPEDTNFETCQEKFKSNTRVQIVNLGVGDRKKQIRFASAGSASKASEDGNLTIEIDTLDNILVENEFSPGYIKIDIEGFELEALRGCENTISRLQPNLAISVYHQPDHFWKVPELILKMNPNYRVYLRHYTESIYETVMYFIPPIKRE